MHKILALALTSVAAAAATPVSAHGAEPFTGPRIGVESGWGRVGGQRAGGDGFTYGAIAGYDIGAGKLRVGPELGISDSTQKDCRADPAAGVNARQCERADRDLYAGVRLGYVASPKLLVFGKAGYTNARFATRLTGLSTTPNEREYADDHSGYRLGAGAEYAVTPNVYVTGEYRYSHWEHDVHQNQLLGGVGLRF